MSTKLKSRFGTSHAESRQLVKAGIVPSAAEAKAYGRPPEMTRREFQRRQRWSNRQARCHEKTLPTYDMDGSFYHEF